MARQRRSRVPTEGNAGAIVRLKDLDPLREVRGGSGKRLFGEAQMASTADPQIAITRQEMEACHGERAAGEPRQAEGTEEAAVVSGDTA